MFIVLQTLRFTESKAGKSLGEGYPSPAGFESTEWPVIALLLQLYYVIPSDVVLF